MKTAIITGASSGLGREFARQLTDVFPEIGCCWLIARREDRLEEIAREMVGVETVCLPLDLCDAMSFTTLQEKLAAEKPEVAMLINNAGCGYLGRMGETETPAATDAAEPPEEPPGTRAVSKGFLVFLKTLGSVEEPIATSSMLRLPV